MRGGEAAPSVSVRTGFFPPRRPMGRVDMSPSKELVRETGFLAAAGFGLVLPAAGFLPARRAGIPSAFAVPSDDLDRNKGFLAGLGLAFSSSSFDLVRKIPVDFGAAFGLDFGVVFGLAFGLVAVGFFPPRLGAGTSSLSSLDLLRPSSLLGKTDPSEEAERVTPRFTAAVALVAALVRADMALPAVLVVAAAALERADMAVPAVLVVAVVAVDVVECVEPLFRSS